MHDILVAAQKIRVERLQSQRVSPELALVNGDHAENSREVTPGDSQENPIIFNDDEDDDGDGENNTRISNGTNTPMDGPRHDDIPQATRKDVGEGAEQPLGDFSQITTEITSTELHAAHQSSALSKVNPFERHGKYATSPAAAPSVPLPSATRLDYVRCLSREQRDQYTLFLPQKLSINVERQQTVLNGSSHEPPSGAGELQSGAKEDSLVGVGDEHESPTEPATPCICEGGPGDCGAQQHKSIEQYSFHQPSANTDAGPNKRSGERSLTATEPSPQPEPVIPQRERVRGPPRPSPPDESRHPSVDAPLQRSLPSRKRSHPVEDDTFPRKSHRTRKETWKVREARKVAALLDSLD